MMMLLPEPEPDLKPRQVPNWAGAGKETLLLLLLLLLGQVLAARELVEMDGKDKNVWSEGEEKTKPPSLETGKKEKIA